MKYLLLAVCLITASSSYAQFSITGKIAEDNKGVRNASVELFRAKDTVLVRSALSNGDGDFKIENISNGDFILRVSITGYKRSFTPVNINDASVNLPLINVQRDVK